MKGKWAAWGLVAVVLVAGAAYWLGNPDQAPWRGGENHPARSAAGAVPDDRAAGEFAARPERDRAAVAGNAATSMLPRAEDYAWPDQAPPTPEQVAWLLRNGYPSPAQFARYGTASSSLLPKDGIARSPEDVVNAEVVAMSDPAHRGQAELVMLNAAENGSIFALGALGRAAASAGDPVDAAAYLRAAAARGDWTMSAVEALLPAKQRPATVGDQTAAWMRAYQVELQLNRARRLRGLPPLVRDVMPGVDEAYERYKREAGTQAQGAGS